MLLVVSYRNSTSNHNLWTTKSASEMLYLIEILHQTTTKRVASSLDLALYLIEILHQTTTARAAFGEQAGCILSKFYIKPQQAHPHHLSKHGCILSKFYIKPQQFGKVYVVPAVVSYRNSTSNHNNRYSDWLETFVVSYRNSTSNHNFVSSVNFLTVLYLIEILHQTTTARPPQSWSLCCILSKFYIKPQRCPTTTLQKPRCILSKFYIKPQLTTRLL